MDENLGTLPLFEVESWMYGRKNGCYHARKIDEIVLRIASREEGKYDLDPQRLSWMHQPTQDHRRLEEHTVAHAWGGNAGH
jgi:hypothetical protein